MLSSFLGWLIVGVVVQLGRVVAKKYFPGMGGSSVPRQVRDRASVLAKEFLGEEKAVEVKWVMTEQDGGVFYRVAIRGCGIPESLTVRDARTILSDTPGTDRVRSGDTSFDQLVAVQGPETVALALLGDSTRASISSLVRDFSGSIDGGTVRLLSGPHYSVETVEIEIRFALKVASSLMRSGSLAERLAANAGGDSVPGVRLRNLLALFSHFPQSAEAAGAAQKALSDTSPYMRLEGASFLGPAGLPTLLAIVDAERMPEEVSTRALRLVGSLLPAEQAGALLVEATRRRRGAPRLAAIELLGRLRHAPATPTLAVLLDEGDGEVASAAAAALGQIEGSEAVLIRALQRHQTEGRIDIVAALGLGGSVTAVPHLLRIVEDSVLPARLRHAAREAVRSIQARTTGASVGQVAIAEALDPEGELSLVDDETPRGALALTEEAEEKPPEPHGALALEAAPGSEVTKQTRQMLGRR